MSQINDDSELPAYLVFITQGGTSL